MNRLVAAAAALGVAAMVVFGPAAAQAAPPRAPAAPPGPLCTPAEWTNPANFARCADAGKAAIDSTVNCLNAPTPTGPDSGFAGMVSVRPDASLYSGHPGQYTDYGAGGYGLATYGLGCAGDVTHATDVALNGMANTAFQASAGWLATANTTRGYAYNPHAMWGWFDSDLDTAVHAMYQHVWLTAAAIFVMLTGVWLIWRARRADVGEATGTVGWVLLVTVGVTLVAQWPSASARIADTAATTGLETVHAAAGLGPQQTPPTQCVLPDPAACVDHRTPSDRMSDSITTSLLYNNWLVAELGSSDSPTAKKYGPALFDAQALTWGQAADIKAHPEQRAALFAEKARTWNNLAAVIRTEDPQAYEHMQGLHGSDRLFVSILTAVEVFLFTSFDMAASLIILLAFGVFRLVIITLPVTGAVGVFNRSAGFLLRGLNAFVAAFRNILAFGTASTVYLFLVNAYFAADALPGVAKTILMGITSLGMWLLVFWLRSHLPNKVGAAVRRRPERAEASTVVWSDDGVRRPAPAWRARAARGYDTYQQAAYRVLLQPPTAQRPWSRPVSPPDRTVYTGQVLPPVGRPAARPGSPANAVTARPEPPRSPR